MKQITIEQAIENIKNTFDLLPFDSKKDEKSFYTLNEKGATFMFDKRQYSREEVIGKLRELFCDSNIIDGQCKISGITFVWTTVDIEKRK